MLTLSVNGEPRTLESGTTLEVLLQQLELLGRRLAVERNGEIVPRSVFAETGLASGDRLEIVGAVGGG